MSPKFGTDGVRGVAYRDLTADFVRRLGMVAARVLDRETFFIGRDTRESGPDFEQAFAAGLHDAGARAVSLGVVSTPAVAWLAAADQQPAAMISASHNPYTDNGIKLFAAGGVKLSDALQDRIEASLHAADGPPPARDVSDLVTVVDGRALVSRYEAAVLDTLDGRDLTGLSIVVDCANGSNSEIAGHVLHKAGAHVELIHYEPDGRNINDHCGSTHPEDLRRLVVARGADAGIAFDGDADRLVAVDHRGELVDGDQIIAICAIDRARRGVLAKNAVAVTVMTNLGFRLAMRREGIDVIETSVGDRAVLEALERNGATLGGEQSGHVIFSDLATTGDGLLTALQLLDVVQRRSRPLAELAASAMVRLPQVLRNVRVSRPVADLSHRLQGAIAQVEAEMSGAGRVLIRPSGTEPVVRIMVEGPSEDQARAAADHLAAMVASLVGE